MRRIWAIFLMILLSLLLLVLVGRTLPQGGAPEAAPAEASVPADQDLLAWDFAGEWRQVLSGLTQHGADEDSFSSLQRLASRAEDLEEYLNERCTDPEQRAMAPFVSRSVELLRLLCEAREAPADPLDSEARRARLDELLTELEPPAGAGEWSRWAPRFQDGLEHDARHALTACRMYALRRQEREEGAASLTLAGDTTFGQYPEVEPFLSFHEEFHRRGDDLAFPLRLTASYFQNDSLSVLNCEGTFTEATRMMQKKYRFKGPAEYIEMFRNGGVEVVNLANNHTMDYLERGYQDTIENLNAYGIAHYGEQDYLVYDSNTEGIRFGFFGYDLFGKEPEPEEMREMLLRDIAALRAYGADVIVATFHWGYEYHNLPNAFQIRTAHMAVDLGADLVVGHHPHVVQGIEQYRGKTILYSLGNFAFGGDEDLKDGGDTMLVRITFRRGEDGSVLAGDPLLVPANVSTSTERNNYVPRPLLGEEADRLAQRVLELSAPLPHGVTQLDYHR